MIAAAPSYDVKPVQALSADERAAWAAMTRARPTLWSPYFQLGFTEQMAVLSGRVRVIVVRAAGAPIAFLPFMAVVAGFAQPVGGPIADMHGLIADDPARIDIAAILGAAGLSFYSFHGVPAEQSGFEAGVRHRYDSHAADLSQGFQAWWERASDGGKRGSFKKAQRDARNLARDYGPLRFELNDTSEAAFAALIAWKRAQYQRSRHFDVFAPRWTGQLLRRLWALREGPLQGQLSSLYAGKQLMAVHFGMKGEHAANYWFPAHDPDHDKHAPGVTLFDYLYRAWAEEGVQRVDLGEGDTRFKLQFGGARVALMGGVARRDTVVARMFRGFGAIGDAMAKAPVGFIAKAPYRISSRVRTKLYYGLV